MAGTAGARVPQLRGGDLGAAGDRVSHREGWPPVAKTVRALDRRTLTWSGQGVDLARIEAELLRLRREAAVGAQPFAVRASVLNLVVYAASEGAARRAAQVVAGLAGQHPSRTLIAGARPSGAEPRLDAE